MNPPKSGIVTDAAHSINDKLTQYRAIDLKTGEQIFIKKLGFQTVNIGEFLGVIAAIKYIIEKDYTPKLIYTDSLTAINWVINKKSSSKKSNPELLKAEIFLQTHHELVDEIEICHWSKKQWGEIPADFGNK